MKKVTQKAFTLAEIMIVLTVIGILTAIILPSARNLMPDKNLMKFKKAHNTLLTAITELVNSDKYYLNGDLGKKPDGTEIVNNETTKQYFCNTFADIINAKKVNCDITTSLGSNVLLSNEKIGNIATGQKVKRPVSEQTIKATKEYLDAHCKKAQIQVGAEIITTDGIAYFQGGSTRFASKLVSPNQTNGLEKEFRMRYFSPPNEFPANYADEQGFDIAYNIFCIDIDDIPQNATETNCINECPFGYGIRADGKILTGAKADEWLAKDVQQN